VVELEGKFMLGNLYWALLSLFLINTFVDSFPVLSHPLVFENIFSAGMPQGDVHVCFALPQCLPMLMWIPSCFIVWRSG
jgi:hypothetical protein